MTRHLIAFALLMLLSPAAWAQSPANTRYVASTCETAMFDAGSKSLSVAGHRAAQPFGGFMRQGRAVECEYAALYRLFETKLPDDAPTPIFTSAQPPCPPGWKLPAANVKGGRCVRVDGTTTPHFFVRRVTRNGESWADSRTCPAILPMLDAMEKLLTPEFTGDKPFNAFPLVLDGVTYRVWAGDLQLGAYGQTMQMATNVGTPLARWTDDSLDKLTPCFSPMTPH